MIDPAPARIELRHLRSFIAVAEELHFRRAAERLHMSQPPLSQQIKTLEEALGVQLLERDRRGVSVTDAGSVFLDQARTVLACMDGAVDAARARRRASSASCRWASSAPPCTDGCRRSCDASAPTHPDVHLSLRELNTAAQIDALVQGEIDVGFLRPPVSAEGIEIDALLEEPVVVVMPEDHHLVGMPSLTLMHLRRERFVLLSRAAAPGQHDAIARALPRTVQLPSSSRRPRRCRRSSVSLRPAWGCRSCPPRSARSTGTTSSTATSSDLPRRSPWPTHSGRDARTPVVEAFLAAVRDLRPPRAALSPVPL